MRFSLRSLLLVALFFTPTIAAFSEYSRTVLEIENVGSSAVYAILCMALVQRPRLLEDLEPIFSAIVWGFAFGAAFGAQLCLPIIFDVPRAPGLLSAVIGVAVSYGFFGAFGCCAYDLCRQFVCGAMGTSD
jgi:hypothetical protein